MHPKDPTQLAKWKIRLEGELFSRWKQEYIFFIILFDVVAKGNTRVAIGGGTISCPDGTKDLKYALGLGNVTNNQVEALALLQGIKQLKRKGIMQA